MVIKFCWEPIYGNLSGDKFIENLFTEIKWILMY